MAAIFTCMLLFVLIATLKAIDGFSMAVSVQRIPPMTRRPMRGIVQLSVLPPSSSSSGIYNVEDQSTIATVTSPSGQVITLIGTAHLSQKSNQQVERVIQEIQPQLIMVELDPSRLSRIGIPSLDSIQVTRVVASGDDVVLPKMTNRKSDDASLLVWKPFWMVQEVITDGISRIARALLTGMYQDMGSKMNQNATSTVKGGGEFLVAIRQAEQLNSVHTLVLGDRSSLTTIKRAATLAFQSGDPLGVLARLQEANAVEMRELERNVRLELTNHGADTTTAVEETQVNIAMMERLKEDSEFRNRLFRKLEKEVPEFTQAFLKERDYIMAETIRRELVDSTHVVEKVVAVVGLAHVPGMEATLLAMFNNLTLPLCQIGSL